MTQSELGKRLGYSGATVSRWENGYAPAWYQRQRLEELEAELERTKAEKLEQVRNFCEECVIKDPSGSTPVNLMREFFYSWCDEKGLNPDELHFDRHLEQLGFRAEAANVPGRAFPRRVWVGVIVKPGLSPVRKDLDAPPEEPTAGPGPNYAPRGGKLAAVPHPPKEGEVQPQARLHTRLRTKVDGLVATLANAGNQYAELMRAADEYALLLKEPTEKLDVVDLWSVGGSLHELLTAYREQSDGTLAPPLEPQMVAALASVVRDHGAFVLGFEEGRALVERADRFALQGELIDEIAEPGTELLEELATNEELVEEETRKVHATIRDTLHATGWEASRTTYAGYLTVRNAFRAIIQFSVNVATVAGGIAGVSAIAGDPNCEFIRTAFPVLQQYAAQLMAFFKHSPEFRAYVQWALDVLENDRIDNEQP